MKLLKRILAIVCTFVMIISMATGVNAVETTATTSTPEKGRITVTGATVGETYSIYKILSLESYDKKSGAYSYTKPGGAWTDYINNDGREFFNTNGNGYVTLKISSDEEARKLAFSAISYAKEHNVKATQTQEASVSKSDETTVVFENLDLGYYVVESTSGTACAITTTDPEVTVNNKHDNPYVQKKIISGGKYNESGTQNSINLGEEVVFQTTIFVKPGAKNYVLHDIMNDNLEFTGVYYAHTNNNINLLGKTTTSNHGDYVVAPDKKHGTGKPLDGCAFELSFTDEFYSKYEAAINNGNITQIIVTYGAKVKDTAQANKPMKNTTYLSYGVHSKSEKSETTTFTYSIPVFNYTGTNTPLAGAKFILSTTEQPDPDNAIKFNPNGSLYRYSVDQTKGTTTLESYAEGEDKGRVDIQGLQEGIYYLKETEAPKGYNKIQRSIKIEILSDGSIKVNDQSIEGDVRVQHNTGSILPSTGGMGTTLIYVVGSILVLASGIVLFSKRKEGTN